MSLPAGSTVLYNPYHVLLFHFLIQWMLLLLQLQKPYGIILIPKARYPAVMASNNKRKKRDEVEHVYVLSLISVSHSLDYQAKHRNVGVFSSKAAASAAAGSVETDYGTFDSAILGQFSEDFVDNRGEVNAPENGCLLRIGSPKTGEGDYVKLTIQKFPLRHGYAEATAAADATTLTSNDGATANVQRKKKKKNEETKAREINETALMVLMKDIMKPAEYKRVNQKIQILAQKMESEAAPLRNTNDHLFGADRQPENLFKVHAGDFWGMIETRNYMIAHLALADEIHDKIAVVHDAQVAWELVLWHYQEMLRLCSSDNLGLRYRFPFLLLHLNRDDDAFCFIVHWIKDDVEKLHKTSKQGDWIYGHKKNSRFLDIFQVCSNANFKYVCLPLLVALACIKMRIIGRDNSAHNRNDQKKQLERILQLIDNRNLTMLPALIHPAPLLSQKRPDYMSPGSPSECYSIVEDAAGIWNPIPGALDRLKRQFGEKPIYNCSLQL